MEQRIMTLLLLALLVPSCSSWSRHTHTLVSSLRSRSRFHHLHEVAGEGQKGQLFSIGGATRRRSEGARLQASSGVSIALDQSALPRGLASMRGLSGLPLLLFLCFTLAFSVLREKIVLPSSVTGAYSEWLALPSWLETTIESIKTPIMQFLVFSKLCVRVLTAKTALVLERGFDTLTRVLDLNQAEDMDIKDWKVCILDERENLDGEIIRYRFELTNPSAVLPLSVGQEVIMCSVDAKDRVLKESFFPVSSHSARGYFDILLRRGEETTPFARTLETLALGDELAFKAGRYRLNYLGPDEEITTMSLVASGLGIAPTLQILRGILPDRDSTVEDTELLWINEDKEDFVCENDVDLLELRHIEKLLVTRVVEQDLYGRDLIRNEQVRRSISPYEPGRVAVLCAPDYVVSNLQMLYADLGYPPEAVLVVSVN